MIDKISFFHCQVQWRLFDIRRIVDIDCCAITTYFVLVLVLQQYANTFITVTVHIAYGVLFFQLRCGYGGFQILGCRIDLYNLNARLGLLLFTVWTSWLDWRSNMLFFRRLELTRRLFWFDCWCGHWMVIGAFQFDFQKIRIQLLIVRHEIFVVVRCVFCFLVVGLNLFAWTLTGLKLNGRLVCFFFVSIRKDEIPWLDSLFFIWFCLKFNKAYFFGLVELVCATFRIVYFNSNKSSLTNHNYKKSTWTIDACKVSARFLSNSLWYE